MQTELADFIRDTPEGREAEAILRKCVHCGFCTATCPTYQVLGDDLDSPRGRIYLMKRARRALLGWALPRTALFTAALKLGQVLRPLLPAGLQAKVPSRTRPSGEWPAPRHRRKMLVLAGCVQPALVPSINAAAARVLDRAGISLVETSGAGCCGGIRFHLNYQEDGRDDMRALIDAWWPAVERGEVEAIVMTASGCGVTVKEYGHLLAHDPAYRDKAARVSSITRDLCEVLTPDMVSASADRGTVAFQSPCTLQHGQQLRGRVEALLAKAGYTLSAVNDAHLCCGSAGAYSLLQPQISGELRGRKLAALQDGRPNVIATANIGCLTHLQGGTATPVRHWIELIDVK